MNVSLQTTATNHGNLRILLNREDVKPQISKEIEKIRKNAKIKGFRPGTVPATMIQKLYGSGIQAEVMNSIINKAITDYQKDHGIRFLGDLLPLTEPLNEQAFDKEEIEFSYEVGITPELDLKSFMNDSKLTQYIIQPTEANIDEEVKSFLAHFSEFKEGETDIQENDLVLLSVEELENGKLKEDGIKSEFSIIVDPQIEDDVRTLLLQKKQGDQFPLNINKIEKNQDLQTTRKYFLRLEESDTRIFDEVFSTEIKKISRKIKPELDKSLFEKAFGPDTNVQNEEDLREKLKQELQEFYNREAQKFMELELSDTITSYNKFEYPDAFLRNWLSTSFEEWKGKSTHDFEHDLIHFKEGLNWQLFKNAIQKDSEIKVEMQDIIQLIIAKYKSQIPGLNFSDEQWNQVAMNVLKDKAKAEEFYHEALTMKSISWLKDQLPKEEHQISLDDFKEKVKELNKKRNNHDHHHHPAEEEHHAEHHHE